MKRLAAFLAFAWLALAGVAQASVTFTSIGSAGNNVTGTNNLTAAVSTNMTGSNNTILIVLGLGVTTTGTVTVSDGTANSYTCATNTSATNISFTFCYVLNAINLTTSNTITVTTGNSITYKGFQLLQVSGTNNAAPTFGTGFTAATTTPIAFTTASILTGYGVVMGAQVTGTPTMTTSTGFTQVGTGIVEGAGSRLFTQYQTTGSTGTISVSSALSVANNWATNYVTFAPSGVATSSPKMMLLGVGQ